METKLSSSRKRKQQSNPFEGIFTRSKSKIYIHRNRSGHARSDPIRRRHHDQLLNGKANSRQLHNSDSSFSDITAHTSVKDLRTRRVFSPPSIIADYGATDKIELEVVLKGENWNDGNPNLSPFVEGDFAAMNSIEKKGVGFSVMENLNPNFEISGDSSGNGDSPSAGSLLNLVGSAANLTDECVKMSPAELEVNCNAVKDGIDSIRKDQSDLHLRSRRKVFEAPSSFSYRRLLPYLMDIIQDDSCVSHIEIVDLNRPGNAQSLTGLVPKISVNRALGVAGKEVTAKQFDRKPVVENGTFHSTDALKIQNDNHVNPNFLPVQDGTRMPNVEERRENLEPSNLIEEYEQMTPPDADVFAKAEDSACFGQKGEKTMLNGSPSNITKKTGGIVENLEDQRNDSISKPKRVLHPCARMKLLKTPSSVSYRRLLPFLMDIAKDNSCTLKVNQCPKVKKDFEQKLIPGVLDSYNLDTTVGKSEKESDSGKQDSEHEKPRTPTPSSLPTESDGSSVETTHTLLVDSLNSMDDKSNIKEPSVAKFSNSTELHITPDSPLGVKLLLEHLVEDSPEKSGKPDPNNWSYGNEANSSSSMCSTVNHDSIPCPCAMEISGNSLLDAKDDFEGLKTPIDKGSPNTLDINQKLSLIEGFDPSRVHVAGRRKGILKRYPPGCKGICDCLKCATFRLHAERAFEFSRNQMLSAEELAVELIEELTCLRNVLQKSAVDSNHAIVLQENQVKEVCRKAMETEELAKQRIAQMNEDLSIHCRKIALERPRVSFARNVEEKVIAMVDLPGK